MKLAIDTEARTITVEDDGRARVLPLYSKEGFESLSREWLRVGWTQRYSYTFSWFGRPLIQMPQDIIRIQEAIYRIRPDVIIETGVAHGGSLVFYATLCRALEKGRVIGVDVHIRPQNRQAIETHELSSLITLIEGSSVDAAVVQEVRKRVRPGESVLVILDSSHQRHHVLEELEHYSPLVSVDSYIIAADGVMQELCDVPQGVREWKWDNPDAAAREFAAAHPEFALARPAWPFNESDLTDDITYWPGGWLRRVR